MRREFGACGSAITCICELLCRHHEAPEADEVDRAILLAAALLAAALLAAALLAAALAATAAPPAAEPAAAMPEVVAAGRPSPVWIVRSEGEPWFPPAVPDADCPLVGGVRLPPPAEFIATSPVLLPPVPPANGVGAGNGNCVELPGSRPADCVPAGPPAPEDWGPEAWVPDAPPGGAELRIAGAAGAAGGGGTTL